jgi:S-adenosylmethionine-diacylglycerol 3-amino-3-carboxypropyl transferase
MTEAPDALPSWVAKAARLPLAFAQVREDARIDLEVVRRLGRGVRVLMVASGGCTAAALAASGNVGRLHLVDPNPTQIALTRLKLRLVQHADPSRRLALLGHAPLPASERRRSVSEELAALELPPEAIGPPAVWSEIGPDHTGRYECCFAALRALLQRHEAELVEVLHPSDPAAQAARVAPETPLGRALDAALDEALALPNLVALFSERATHNPRMPFSRHFAERTRHVLATLPAADNPYLWQMYRGRFPEGVAHPWLTAEPSADWPELVFSSTDMQTALAQTDDRHDLVHLSNILDWLPESEAADLLAHARAALRPGGVVLIRQLNSTLDIPRLGPDVTWQPDTAQALHRADRSFFYRELHLGGRR